MAIKRKTSRTPEIPLTSTSDVAFLLLIFFLVAASNSRDQGMPMDIPGTEKTTETTQVQNIELEIKPDHLLVGTERVEADADLAALLRQKLEGRAEAAERVIPVTSDGSVPYQRWSDIMAAIEDAGGIPAPQIVEMDSGAAPAAGADGRPSASELMSGQADAKGPPGKGKGRKGGRP